MIRKGSIVSVKVMEPTLVETLGEVEAVEENFVRISNPITSIGGGEWVPTKNISKEYTGEDIEDCKLADENAFDIYYDFFVNLSLTV